MKKIAIILSTLVSTSIMAQNTMTPEMLIELRKVSPAGVTADSKHVIYSVSQYSIAKNKSTTTHYKTPIKGGAPIQINDINDYLADTKISSTGKYKIYDKAVKLKKVSGQDYYNDVPESEVQIYDELDYRHWDTWNDGTYNHVFLSFADGSYPVDIMKGALYNCPTKPFGGSEDYIWNPAGNKIIYVCKKLSGTAYAKSTNTDLYEYDIATKTTKNLTADNKGYDLNPSYSPKGILTWLQMKRDGYEADKNDIIIMQNGIAKNLTAHWDGTVNSYFWSPDSRHIYFTAATLGTVQVFKINVKNYKKAPQQVTSGQFDITDIVGQADGELIVGRTDMNHAKELFAVNLKSGNMRQLTFENKATYDKITLGKIEKRITKTTDGKDLHSWVIYPPNFDANKKYPTLLYCQGGPQSALSQFYSYRWNFQQMAAHGYIIIAPNRRGMPGYGTEWNEQISKDYGGQNMKDYLSAIDDLSTEPYVDTERLGCIGASYGGYSVFFLAGNHNNRFKTFIAHDGIFNLKSMYGTTEEMFFVNWDIGPYWEKDALTKKIYEKFNPINFVDKWNTPILIIQGGKDYRVPIGQSLEAFNAAQLRGIKSRILYFPNENHWVLNGQNALIWQRQFFKWLKETL